MQDWNFGSGEAGGGLNATVWRHTLNLTNIHTFTQTHMQTSSVCNTRDTLNSDYSFGRAGPRQSYYITQSRL